MNCTIPVAKTQTLISFAVTAKLICVFVFAYADCWFSHEAAHIFSNTGVHRGIPIFLICVPKHRLWVLAVLMCTHNLCFEQI